MRSDLTSEELERIVAETIWLNYFNRYLFKHGTISERKYKRMFEKIVAKESKLLKGNL